MSDIHSGHSVVAHRRRTPSPVIYIFTYTIHRISITLIYHYQMTSQPLNDVMTPQYDPIVCNEVYHYLLVLRVGNHDVQFVFNVTAQEITHV